MWDELGACSPEMTANYRRLEASASIPAYPNSAARLGSEQQRRRRPRAAAGHGTKSGGLTLDRK
jgi:hypothetical protein